MRTSSTSGSASRSTVRLLPTVCSTPSSAGWQQLSLYPYSGVAREDIAPGLRCLVAGQYLTLYRIAADGILIIRVLHGRRKIGGDEVA